MQYGDLSFRDFVELALYHPRSGYYARAESPVGKGGDYVTAPLLSPAFSFAIGRLVGEFLSCVNDGLSTIADIGCGDGSLIRALAAGDGRVRYFGVDRELGRARHDDDADQSPRLSFVRTIDELPHDGAHLILSNELFDALPFTRLVQRGEHLHELWVTDEDGELTWREHEAAPVYDDYFAERGIELQDGQFADISLDWGALYGDLTKHVERGLIVTFDYGFPERQLFHPRIRRFGTAASYSQQRVSRDLLAHPGRQDLTAHVNFSDLQRAGERLGFTTLFFDRQAKFLLSLGITEHELFTPVTELQAGSAREGVDLLERREEARRLVLPDGIGEDIRVLVQGKNVPAEGWSFQRDLFSVDSR